MYILGLSSYSHESSCALIKDGVVRIVLEEERLNREKHTWKFPEYAIRECLAFEGITLDDIDHFTFFWVPERELLGNVAHFIRFLPNSLNLFRVPPNLDALPFFKRIKFKKSVGRDLADRFHLKKAPKFHYIQHHFGHAASAFYGSPFEEAAILTIDGRGEATSTMFCVGRENKIEKILKIKVPHSLGHFYASITDYLGFRPFFDEWKVMGMSAYGKDTYCKLFKDVLLLRDSGDYRVNLKYFNFHTHGQESWVSEHFIKQFGPKRKRTDDYEQKHFDIAYALQKTVEDAGVHLANYLYRLTGMKNLCMTGGVVLNCLMNKRIIEESPFENVFIQPIANDAGTSFGSALYYYHHKLGNANRSRFDSVYLGLEFDDQRVEEVLMANGLDYVKSQNIAQDTARQIADGKIVGWFQGRMEAGPRALGNRSIVVDPRDPQMKDRLNARVKKREFFRPFAPSVLQERVADYFIMPKNQLSPYMILIGNVREDKKGIIPAVTHKDGTARVHTVDQKVNPRYWKLIHEFEKLTGVPVLINTSFNENEPIVCTPQNAVDCFLRTEFDVLAIGSFMATKKNHGDQIEQEEYEQTAQRAGRAL